MTQPTRKQQGEKAAAPRKATPAEKNPATARRADRRVIRSRRAIVEAFMRLIKATPLDKITVSAIAREADVDRKTFYQHFGSVDGLLAYISEQEVSELLDEVEAAMGEGEGSNGESRALRVFFSALTERLSQSLLQEERSYDNLPPELLINYLLHPLTRQIVERGLADGQVGDDEVEMTLSFVLGGLLSIYRWWLQSDRSIPVDEVMRLASELSERGLFSRYGSGLRDESADETDA